MLHQLDKKDFTQIDNYRWQIVFEDPITLGQAEDFLIKEKDANTWLKADNNDETNLWIYSNTNKSNNYRLAPGTYYSVTIENSAICDFVVSFNSELGETSKYTLHTWGRPSENHLLA